MFGSLVKKIFGSANERVIAKAGSVLNHVNALEDDIKKLSDSELAAQTALFKKQLERGSTLDEVLPKAFAVMREAGNRLLKMRHFDVQVVGGLILHQGKIAEMKTGEGKTLVATLPVYLNALMGQGVHVVTVNDYLAQRDANWMGKLYEFLGLSVGCIVNASSDKDRRRAYYADITYGTNNEFGFDYLRDNLKYSLDEMVQRKFHYAIVDEVDSILIDEARTPLIISGAVEYKSSLYTMMSSVVKSLSVDDFQVDEESKHVNLTEAGYEKIEGALRARNVIAEDTGLYDQENLSAVHHLNQALRAALLFKRDKDYIVREGKVMIIDEFTGRIMQGRRYSDGLHQAIEAKEGVKVERENQTFASITFQNYFRMYQKLAGMTGTAMTEANEFADIYKLDVVSIPTNLPITRDDEDDQVYKVASAKYEAIIEEVETAHAKGQPVLVGTVSIEKSDYLSSLLKKRKIKHNVLNARYHEQEANIIAQAGKGGAVTIATNMAGRGTDIMLGGNPQMLLRQKSEGLSKQEVESLREKIEVEVASDKERVLSSGGLFVIATERHESRRIDNQLRGRSGRQGDVGRTKFFLSLEDDLMRLFGSKKMIGFLSKLGMQDSEPIVHPWVTKALEKAQKRVESRNYDMRKNLLKFDNVMNEQRNIVYAQRHSVLASDDLLSVVKGIAADLIGAFLQEYEVAALRANEDVILKIHERFAAIFGFDLSPRDFEIKQSDVKKQCLELKRNAILKVKGILDGSAENCSKHAFNNALRRILLLSLDKLWKGHLYALDHMRSGIGLRAYAQKDPLNEYKVEAFHLFQSMLKSLDEKIVSDCLRLQLPENANVLLDPVNSVFDLDFVNEGGVAVQEGESLSAKDDIPKVGRNDLCPCNSGKKYKHCHGMLRG